MRQTEQNEPERDEHSRPEGFVPGKRRYIKLPPISPEREQMVQRAGDALLREHRSRLPDVIKRARRGIPRTKRELFQLIYDAYPIKGGLIAGESAWDVLWASKQLPTPRKLFDAVAQVANAPGWAEGHPKVLIGEFLRKRMWEAPLVEALEENLTTLLSGPKIL